MKIKLLLTFLLLNIGCAAQNKTINNISNIKNDTIMAEEQFLENMKYELDNKFEVFDSVLYNRLQTNPKEDYFIKTLDNGTCIKMYNMESYRKTPENSPFSILKLYYPNGNIKEKGFCYVNGFTLGIWYSFDENGNLIKTENEDKKHKIKWQDIFRFCWQQEIPIARGKETEPMIDVYQDENFDNKWVWLISWTKKDTWLRHVWFIDAETGIILKEKKDFMTY